MVKSRKEIEINYPLISANEFSSTSQNEIKSINSTNFLRLYQDKDSFNKNTERSSKRSNGQSKSFTGIQSLSFIGKKDKFGNKNGFGIQKWKDGNIYEGNFINNKAEGWGIFYYSDGDMYKGSFENDITKGYGEYYHNKEVIYYGYWLDDVQVGIGYEIWAESSQYFGNYKMLPP